MKFIKVVCILAALQTSTAFAQQNPFSSSYTLNEQFSSPSNVGIYDYMLVNASTRLQMLGFDDGPRTHFISANTAIDDMHSGGIMAFSDKFGVTQQTGIYLDYAYRMPIGLDYNVSFGIGPKLFSYSFNDSGIDVVDPGDPVFGNNEESSFSVDARVGVSIFSDDLLVSLSADNLIESSIKLAQKDNRLNNLQREFKLYAHYHYQLEQANNFAIEPSVMLRSKLYGHYILEGNIDVVYMDLFYAGVHYRHDNAYGFRLGARSKEIIFTYQFEVVSSDLSELGKTSHEIGLGFRIFNDKSSQNNRWYERHKENAWIGKDSFINRDKE